jgi:hypothetical protein
VLAVEVIYSVYWMRNEKMIMNDECGDIGEIVVTHLRHYLYIWPEELRKPTKTSNKVILSPGRGLNWSPPKYKAGMPTITPQLIVLCAIVLN